MKPAPTKSVLTAKIVEWDHQKSYGFLQLAKERVFLHRSDFVEHHKKPAVGDVIRFILGKDARGRICATHAAHANDGGRITALNVLMVLSLLTLPAIALQRRAVDFRWTGVYVLVLGAVTYWAYASDKRRARDKAWRLSEGSLHLLELLGGWPSAFLAQRRLRHKCSKVSYQVVFWLTVLGYQFAAYDSLQEWQFSRSVLNRLEHTLEHRR